MNTDSIYKSENVAKLQNSFFVNKAGNIDEQGEKAHLG